MTSSPLTDQLTIRPAYADDHHQLVRLAALDSAPAVPTGPLLLAEVDGTLRAALAVHSGDALADPFYASAALVALLRAHAATAAPVRRRVRRRRWRRHPRLAEA